MVKTVWGKENEAENTSFSSSWWWLPWDLTWITGWYLCIESRQTWCRHTGDLLLVNLIRSKEMACWLFQTAPGEGLWWCWCLSPLVSWFHSPPPPPAPLQTTHSELAERS